MGGITSSPSVTTVAAPAPEPDTSDAGETQARLNAVARNRRGRDGTVLTSDRGLMRANEKAAQKKTLLGE